MDQIQQLKTILNSFSNGKMMFSVRAPKALSKRSHSPRYKQKRDRFQAHLERELNVLDSWTLKLEVIIARVHRLGRILTGATVVGCLQLGKLFERNIEHDYYKDTLKNLIGWRWNRPALVLS